ncbi:MAG: diaminopimelate epimerase [Bifidobacteriaceae bacterium]|jgi:diaminopimelate epimerase|nr:diaminopimelate epimerase [Bifidobacteriaceae bacterium]
MAERSDLGLAGLVFAKGHGTENDFVLYSDPDGGTPLTGAMAAALADRRAGVGADGVIRAVRTAAAGPVGDFPGEAEWFMDYRNADGSPAEMCGNGLRVYAEYLRQEGLIDLAPGGSAVIATRGGARRVRWEPPLYTVDMGPWAFPGGPAALELGGDVVVEAPGLGRRRGLRVEAPNPHAVVLVAAGELAGIDLASPPRIEPVPDAGANVEFMAGGSGALAMRVHERGSGETRSCGTGAVAAAAAARALIDPGQARWDVEVPGGVLAVTLTGATARLTGPAVLVASGRLLRGRGLSWA